MDYFKQQERKDLEQLTMVLQYVKELNKSALLELQKYDAKVKRENDQQMKQIEQ